MPSDPALERWQARLRYAVAKAGGKRYLIARDAGVAPETLSRLMNDPNQRPSLDTITKIAHAVGVSVGWLLEEDDYRLTEPDRRQLRAAADLILRLVR